MIPKIKQMLLRLAEANEGVNGYRMAAGVVYKKTLLSTGVNHKKTHPIMLNDGYRDKQVYLHAEADAIKNALRLVPQSTLVKSDIYVVRLKKDPRGNTYEGLAKPCAGCTNLIIQYGLKGVYWTNDEDICYHRKEWSRPSSNS